MADNFTKSISSPAYATGRNGALLLLVISMNFSVAAAPSPTKPLTPPSQIAALNFAYHSMTAHTCGPSVVDTQSCTARKQRQAIIRSDYRVLPNGMASVWLELLTQPPATSHIPAPIIHTTIELELRSTPEGDLVATTTRTLTSETWESGTDLQKALAETRLRGLVYRWLILFEQPDTDEAALLTHTRPTTTLDPATGPRLTGHEQIKKWFTAQRQRQKKVQQQVEVIDITLFAPRHYRLDFAVNWQGQDTDGVLRIGRKEYRWEVELGTDNALHITHIREQNALPLPNMGTRIFC